MLFLTALAIASNHHSVRFCSYYCLRPHERATHSLALVPAVGFPRLILTRVLNRKLTVAKLPAPRSRNPPAGAAETKAFPLRLQPLPSRPRAEPHPHIKQPISPRTSNPRSELLESKSLPKPGRPPKPTWQPHKRSSRSPRS